jgi:2,4-dienoyl-CoA reductase-like NADH-dependent reductase (Old Yellow Enzyme family)
MADLFSSIDIKNKTIKNRIVLPPMVRFGWSDSKGFVSEKHIKHYGLVAENGPGLIIIEALAIKKDGRLSPDQLGIWSNEHVEGIGKIAEACHKNGAIVTAQIHHAGLSTPASVSSMAVAPSDHYKDGRKIAQTLTVVEIEDIQEAFVEAVKRVMEAGLDGIEIHGAHGYLIGQFMSPVVNERDDGYGGDINKRARFSLETIEKIKSTVGNKDFIIGYRMGGNEPTLKNGIKIAKILENAGVDLLHVSSGIEGETLPEPPKGFKYNWIVYCGTEIKKNISIPVITVNEIRTPDQAMYLINNNMADFAAIGKGLLCDPDWTEKAKGNNEVKVCLECKECDWFTEPEKCPRYRKLLKSV